jgi:hypothetical protein
MSFSVIGTEKKGIISLWINNTDHILSIGEAIALKASLYKAIGDNKMLP